MVEIKALSHQMHQKLVGWTPEPLGYKVRDQQAAKLAQFGLDKAKDSSEVVEMPLPNFDTYLDVLTRATEAYGVPVFERLEQLLTLKVGKASWATAPNCGGWVFKDFSPASRWEVVEPPQGQLMVLDFENITHGDTYEDFGKRIKRPVCGVGLTLAGIWLWQWNPLELETVVPFGRDNIIIGHNIPYDRQFLDIEYFQANSGNVFVDTMSMWIPVHGMGNQQLIPYQAMLGDEYAPGWMQDTASNGLAAIYQYYFGLELDKGVRDEIVDIGYLYVIRNRDKVTEYCWHDVLATLAVFKKLYPEYTAFRPSSVNRTASLLMGSYWCPLSAERYPTYFEKVEAMYHETLESINKDIGEAVEALAERTLKLYRAQYVAAKEYLGKKAKKEDITTWLNEWVNDLNDPQLNCLDWTPLNSKKFGLVPTWYAKYLSEGFRMGTKETVFILGTTYKGYKILWEGDHKTGRFITAELGDIPNPEERGKRVSNLFTKACEELVKPDENGVSVISAPGRLGDLIVLLMSLVNWKSLRKRVYHIHTESPEGFPVFLPLLSVNGTITGRCADRLTQVLPNPKPKRLGTGTKSLIEAPEGYVILGGDISSQELCIAAWLGDLEAPRNYRGLSRPFLGSCPLSVAVMTGTSSTKTDVHSVMAAEQGMERDEVKPEVYGAIYGQAVKGCTEYLMKTKPSWSEAKCKEKATVFTNKFVGTRDGYVYKDGLASECFNHINRRIATDPKMVTPVFECVASTSLTSAKRDFKTTKVNRIVQASGSDWRDSLVVMTKYFYDYYQVRGRLMLTIHDEIRTLVHQDDVKQASYCLMLAHVYTTALFIDQLGLDLVPASKAWFEELDCTKHLSKAWDKPGKCPEYPEGLPTGYRVTANDVKAWVESGKVTV